jgi:hypothetical protein
MCFLLSATFLYRKCDRAGAHAVRGQAVGYIYVELSVREERMRIDCLFYGNA